MQSCYHKLGSGDGGLTVKAKRIISMIATRRKGYER